MNISNEPHDYQPVLNAPKILTLGISRPNDCINYIISGSFDVPILWSRVWFRMPIADKRASITYGKNKLNRGWSSEESHVSGESW